MAVVVLAWRSKGPWRKLLSAHACFFLVLAWWSTLRPSNERPWQPDVAQAPFAEIDGDTITFHNVRNCEYRSETDYTPHWETRSYRLSDLRAVDLAITYWGSPWMAHPIASFQFADGPPVAISIETRKEVGESYSAMGGLYRQFELVYVVADERDLIRLRTNFRKGEDVYLMRTALGAEQARNFLLQYVAAMNALQKTPRWYNAITTNCTTTIRDQRPAEERAALDWRLLVNGVADEMLHERGALRTDNLPFPEFKRRSRINEKAMAAGDAPDFSQRIRDGQPGFGT